MLKLLITFAVASLLAINAKADNTPLVIWHGMGKEHIINDFNSLILIA